MSKENYCKAEIILKCTSSPPSSCKFYSKGEGLKFCTFSTMENSIWTCKSRLAKEEAIRLLLSELVKSYCYPPTTEEIDLDKAGS